LDQVQLESKEAMKYIYIILFVFSLLACNEERSSTQKKIIEPYKDTVDKSEKVPIFWRTICEKQQFSNFFDCSNSDCYQIELLNDPFKDFVVLTVNTQDSFFDIINYHRFAFKVSKNSTDHSNSRKPLFMIPIVNTSMQDTIFCLCMGEKKRKRKKNATLNIFFSKYIWEIPQNEEDTPELDNETWKIKARSGGSEILLSRHNFKDSLYYASIQNILNECNINDYRYKKR
jgi:hypothetical protein